MLSHLAGLRSSSNVHWRLTVRWQGEPVVVVVAEGAPLLKMPLKLSRLISPRWTRLLIRPRPWQPMRR